MDFAIKVHGEGAGQFVPQKYKDCERKCFINGGVQEEANELQCGDRGTKSLMVCPV